ncbi:MAG: 3'-5' exonuclease, partial [Myxococcota bacterium]
MSRWRDFWERRKLTRLRRSLQPSDPRLAAYLLNYARPPPQTPLDQVRFVVLDTEATGLDTANDRVLTIAAVAVVDGALRSDDSLELTIARDRVGREAAPIHGMVSEDLAEGVDEAEATGQFVEFLGNDILVAHHAGFDRGILSSACQRMGGPPLLNLVLDTESLSRRVELGPVQPETNLRFSLDAVAERFSLETDARHTAAGDALLTAELSWCRARFRS